MTSTGSLHLVLPCINESGRITRFLPDLCGQMDAAGDCRILVVDDGSGDQEQQRMRDIINGLKRTHPCLLPPLLLPRNLGKGGAVYAGWRANEGAEWLGFVDADGSVPAGEVARLLRIARERGAAAGAIIASRVMLLGRSVQRHLHRHLMGRVYSILVSGLLNLRVYDSQCGCKLVPAADFRAIEPALSTSEFAFDAELLVSLLDSGRQVREEPVDWHEVAGGKVRLLHDSIRMFRDVLLIRRQRARLKHR